MTDINKLRVWANELTNVVEPDVELQDEGYVGGDQPFAEHHDWIWWRRDKTVNQLIDEANYGRTQGAGLSTEEQASELYYGIQDWLHPWSTKNKVTLPSEPIDMCPGWDFTLEKQVVYVARLGYSGVTQINNSDAGGIAVTHRALTLDDGAEVIDAICSDGDYLYVLTTGKPTFNATVYKFSANPWSSTPVWSLDIGTIFLFNTTNRGKNDLIVADGDWIATPLTNTAPSTGKSVMLINKDGLSTRSGRGNAPNNASYLTSPYLASNGTNLFFAVEDVGGQKPTFCTADIADPDLATNGGGAVNNNVAVTDGNVGVGSIIHDGHLIHWLTASGRIYSYDWDSDISSALTHSQWTISRTPAPQVGTTAPSAAFDGMYMWTLWEYDGETDNDNGFFIPINVAEETMDEAGAKAISDPRILIQPPLPSGPSMSSTKTVYLDNCLFTTLYIAPGAGSGFDILRLPNLQARKR